MNDLMAKLMKASAKPRLFEPGEPRFWDDPHISKSMLEAHLNPGHDAASRKPEKIDSTVRHLLDLGVLKPGMKLLDLGCGPGLYAERLYRAGIHVVGLDISQRSIDYAKRHAAQSGMDIEYRCMDFFDMDYTGEFDAAIQIYGELCVFSDEMLDKLLRLIRKALKQGGTFVFDVSTRTLRMKAGLKNNWYVSQGGFWHPKEHLVLEQGFDYPEKNVWLDQYILVCGQEVKVYRNWFHDYSGESISKVMASSGFDIKYMWNDFTGSELSEGGDWIGLVAVKKDPFCAFASGC